MSNWPRYYYGMMISTSRLHIFIKLCFTISKIMKLTLGQSTYSEYPHRPRPASLVKHLKPLHGRTDERYPTHPI